MKINPGLKQTTLSTPVENRPAQPSSSKNSSSGTTGISLSPRAAQLKQMETELASLPVIDQARVDSIKEAIANGQYAINAGNIAESLIQSVKEMLHANK